jgi:hypothetical protein
MEFVGRVRAVPAPEFRSYEQVRVPQKLVLEGVVHSSR